MPWLDYVSHFFGGAFLANAVPHLVAGVQGRPFQTPFAKPPGKGLSSSRTNVLWSFLNLAVAYVLIVQVGQFDLRAIDDVAAAGLGGLIMSLMTANIFGEIYGGKSRAGA